MLIFKLHILSLFILYVGVKASSFPPYCGDGDLCGLVIL